MSTDRDLKAHAKLVAKDLKAGKATANTDRAIEFMGEKSMKLSPRLVDTIRAQLALPAEPLVARWLAR